MNKVFKIKNLAFTLAEMMVILAVFSVISAATLPVITARQNADNSDSVTNASTARNPWISNRDYNALGYYDSFSALGNTSAVMVGGQVSERAYAIGYPQLIVKDNYGVNGSSSGSQIVFLKKNNDNNNYYGGRIALGIDNKMSYGSVAFGSNAMYEMPMSSISAYGNVAIGSNTIIRNHNVTGFKTTYNTAIGKKVFGLANNDSVGIGTEIIYSSTISQSLNRNVAIGYGINSYFVDGTVSIGSYAGGNSSSSSVTIGTYAGYNNCGTGRVNIGYFSGYSTNSGVYKDNYSITIGHYAGAYSVSGTANFYNMIAIGTAAGKDIQQSGPNGIYIGKYAGTHSHTNISNIYQTIMIGNYAGYYKTNSNTKTHFHHSSPIIMGEYAGYGLLSQKNDDKQSPVIIGPNAYRQNDKSVAYFPDVVIGNYAAAYTSHDMKGSVIIGTYAGYSSSSDITKSVCIGKWSCAFGAGYYSTIISPYGYYYKSGKGLKASTSVIGYPESIENYYSYLDAAYNGNSVSLYNQLTSSSGEGNKYANMVLAPDRYNITGNRIFFYTNKLYGPKATFDIFSDRRLKTNIKPSIYGLNEVRKINIYEFNYKNDSSNTPHIGVIAQELQKIIPEAVSKLGNTEYLAVKADWIIYPMINAIQSLDKSVLNIDSGMNKYLTEYKTLADKVSKLEKEVKNLEKENKSLARDINIAYKRAKMAESRQ